MAPLFDTYIIVDWSAANAPKRGKDSIWIGSATRTGGEVKLAEPLNVSTRSAAISHIEAELEYATLNRRRVFVGFDFPFGYPKGAAKAIAGTARWRALWQHFAERIEDSDDNRSNRFETANTINTLCFPHAPMYWGRPHQHRYPHLSAKKPFEPRRAVPEFRLVEKSARPAKSVWQLAYNGAVGSQAMLGMARLERLRTALEGRAAVWPFETRFDERLEAPITLAEIYPSLFDVTPLPGETKDSAQVRSLAAAFSALDAKERFRRFLAAPPDLFPSDLKSALDEEGWIVGVGRTEERGRS